LVEAPIAIPSKILNVIFSAVAYPRRGRIQEGGVVFFGKKI